MTLYRDATHDDRRFIVSAWASSYKSAHAAGMIASDDWATVMHAQIAKLLSRAGTRSVIAYEPEGDLGDFTYGFIAGDPTHEPDPIVFYVYVKEPFRSQPITGQRGARSGPRHARGLFDAIGIDPGKPFLYACRTAIVSRIGHKFDYRARFVPAAARYVNYQQQERDE